MEDLREKYIDGKLYKVGDIVIHKGNRSLHEVMDLGTNYLTVTDQNGHISKMWITDAVLAEELKEDFNDARRKRSSSSQVAFVGYKTKNFKEEIYEAFKQSLQIKEAKKQKFLMLNLIRQTDNLLENLNSLNINTYSKVRALYEQTEKCLDKLNISCYHGYRSEIKEKLNEFELSEGLFITGADKEKAIQVLAHALNMDVSHMSTDEEKVNAVAYHIKSGRWSPEAWKIMGTMLNQMTVIGIKWNKDIFSKPTQKAMGLK